MIFGKTYGQKREAELKWLEERYKKRVREFAWFPRRVNDGRYVWLAPVWVDYGICKPSPSSRREYDRLSWATFYLNETGDV